LSLIKTFFELEYECSLKLEGYDKIAQNNLHPGDYVTNDDLDSNDKNDNEVSYDE
jgi:hypothetical protein